MQSTGRPGATPRPPRDDITAFFPFDELRPSQGALLEWLQSNYIRYDVFVLKCPVAFGKSGIAYTIAKWANDNNVAVRITAPDNVLVAQLERDYDLPTVPYRNQFMNSATFQDAISKRRTEPLLLMNNWSLLANRLYGEIQIMDEAHTLIPMLQDFEGVCWWHHLDPFSTPAELAGIRSIADAALHFQKIVSHFGKRKDLTPAQKKARSTAKDLLKGLSKAANDFVFIREEAEYRGNLRPCFRLYPLTPKANAPILWPPHRVKKLILMSATIAEPDVRDLGLTNRRVAYFDADSDIPVDRRPWYFRGVGSMGRNKSKDTLQQIVQTLIDLQDAHEGRGFIHSTYGLSDELRSMLPENRFIVHTAQNKKILWDEWRNNPNDPRAFVGAGMTTGIDMKGGIAEWQAILKCQFPDLEDPAVGGKAALDPKWYAWTTIKQILQAYGRVCRTPTDYGATFILDSDFIRLYSKWSQLFPKWFRAAHHK